MKLPENSANFHSLRPDIARNLSHTTKSLPVMESITPRWLLAFMPWVSVEAGSYRINKVRKFYEMDDNESGDCGKHVKLCSGNLGEYDMTQTFLDYEESPSEYVLNLIQTILKVNTHVTDIFNHPINQMQEQTRLAIEAMRERQEWEILNNKSFGLTNSVAPSMRIQPRNGVPTPDDMDELLARVWKKPAFFLAHPKAIAAFGRECTHRGVPPAVVNFYGCPFMTWRGVPLVPSDKLMFNKDSSTNILLMRIGEKEQGVIGLHQPGIPDETCVPSLSMRFAGIDGRGVAAYIMSLYFSVAVMMEDALGMMENVEVESYYEY